MKTKNGGYVIIDLSQTTDLYTQLSKAVETEKPILVYGDDVPYYADSLTYDSDSDTYSITKGGQVIEVDSDNAITKTGYKDNMLLSQIVDDDGNKRFIEFDLTPQSVEGLTIEYSKASLSGTHLMIVVFGNVTAGTSISNGTTLGIVDLSNYSWINNKIYPLVTIGTLERIARVTYKGFDEEYGTNDYYAFLNRTTDASSLSIVTGAMTPTNDEYFRIQFDLLIDTE